MKYFIKNIFFFAIFFFVFDKVFYLLLPVFPNLEKDKRLEDLMNSKINKEIIIIGSSRGARDIIASQIEDSIGVSTYNLSYPGSNIEFHEFLLQTLINFNKKPSTVMLVMDDSYELLKDETLKFRLDRLYPLTKYKYIYNEIKKHDNQRYYSDLFILTRLNKRNFDFTKRHFNSLDTMLECGSMPVSFQKKGYTFKFNNTAPKYVVQNESQKLLSAFNNFQELCVKNDIKLIIVYPPNFGIHNYLFENRIRKLSKQNVKHFIFNTSNPVYKNNLYYYDYAHLKRNGAEIFTNEIIKYLNCN